MKIDVSCLVILHKRLERVAYLSMIKSIKLTKEDILAMQLAEHVLCQSLFVDGKLPRSKITLICGRLKVELVGGANIQFLPSISKPSKVECHCMIFQCRYNYSWTTASQLVDPNDELELLWYPDSHITTNMLQQGIYGDSLALAIHKPHVVVPLLLSVIVTGKQIGRAHV